jgi:hypothetical protein
LADNGSGEWWCYSNTRCGCRSQHQLVVLVILQWQLIKWLYDIGW